MGDAGDNVGNSSHKDISTPIPSLAEEEAILKKKYGGLMPKKPPLISKVSFMHMGIWDQVSEENDIFL
jgi:hypothetical protein